MKLLSLNASFGPIARGTIRTSGALGLRLLVQAGTLLLVARMLGPERFGAFTGIAALAVILGTLATFGTHLVLLGETAKAPGRRDDVLPHALPTTLLCGSALLLVYLTICLQLLHETGVSLAVLIALGTTEILLQPLLLLPAMEHLALGRIARSQLLQILPLALRLIAAGAVFASATEDPLTMYAYGCLLASLLALIAALFTLPTPWPTPRQWRPPSIRQLRNAAGYAALGITATAPAEIDKTMAVRMLSPAASGLYAAGARVIGALTLPIIAMMLSALPRLFREGHAQPQKTRRLLRWIHIAALGYSLVLAALLWFSAPLFAHLFGPQYQGIEQMIHWLCPAIPGMAMRITAGSILMALGKPWMRAGFEVIGLAVLPLSAIALTPHFGAIGMPLALACSESVMAIVGMLCILYTNARMAAAPAT